MSERKRLWPLLTAALIGLPVLYVLSWGPAYGAFIYAGRHGWVERKGRASWVLQTFYRPVILARRDAPVPIGATLRWYEGLFTPGKRY